MTSATPIPVAIFGKDPKIARSVCEKLLPDFEAVHVCLDLPTALSELPALFSSSSPITTAAATGGGQNSPTAPPAPASGLGTNAYTLDPSKRRAKVPRAVFFGGKFSDDEFNAIVDAVKRATAGTDSAGFEKQQVWGGSGSGSGSGDGNGQQQQQQPQRREAVHFIKVQKRDVLAAGSFGPNADVICKVFRKKMAAALDKAEREREREREPPQP